MDRLNEADDTSIAARSVNDYTDTDKIKDSSNKDIKKRKDKKKDQDENDIIKKDTKTTFDATKYIDT